MAHVCWFMAPTQTQWQESAEEHWHHCCCDFSSRALWSLTGWLITKTHLSFPDPAWAGKMFLSPLTLEVSEENWWLTASLSSLWPHHRWPSQKGILGGASALWMQWEVAAVFYLVKCEAVASSVIPQQEGCRLDSNPSLSVHAWVLSGHSSFLPQS